MGNLLDCSADPLDDIHEDSNGPRVHLPRDADDAEIRSTAGGKSGKDDETAEMEPLQDSAGNHESRGSLGRRVARPMYIEKDVPLRESVIWRLQREYYQKHGVKCWERTAVPCFVTSNAFVARAYARIVAGLLRDWYASGEADQEQPVTILEVGAGHGKFSFLFLKHLMEMREFLPSLKVPGERVDGSSHSGSFATSDLPFRYVVTDISQPILDYIASHPALKKHVDDGVLDVALLDAERAEGGRLYLQLSNRHIDLSAATASPVVAICNYLFDSLVQDAFRVKNGVLYENRLTVTTERRLKGGLKGLSFDNLQGLALEWQHEAFPVELGDNGAIYGEGGACRGPSRGSTHADAADAAWAEAGAVRAVSEGVTRSPPAEEPQQQVEVPLGFEDSDLQAGQGTPPSLLTPKPETVDGSHLNGSVVLSPAAAAGNGGSAVATPLKNSHKGLGSENGEEGLAGSSSGAEGGESSARLRDGDFDPELRAYAQDPELQKTFGDDGASILVPLGALRLLRFLSGLGGGRAAVLVGDKGYALPADLRGDRDPHVAVHGSVSLMVNLVMIDRYVRRKGGLVLSTPYREGFKCQALVFGLREHRIQEFSLAWDDSMAALGPEGFSTLQRALREEVPEASLRHILAVLRLAAQDPDVFFKLKKPLIDQVSAQELAPSAWADLRADIDAVVANHYQLQPSKDVNFEAARVLMAIKDFEGAMSMFSASNKACGAHHITLHNIGVCLFHLGLHHQAVQRFQQCLQMNPEFEDAGSWLAHTQRAMRHAEEEARRRKH